MSRSRPVQELPDGSQIYADPGGTFSHRHPLERWWCERHLSVEEARACHQRMGMQEMRPPSPPSPPAQ